MASITTIMQHFPATPHIYIVQTSGEHTVCMEKSVAFIKRIISLNVVCLKGSTFPVEETGLNSKTYPGTTICAFSLNGALTHLITSVEHLSSASSDHVSQSAGTGTCAGCQLAVLPPAHRLLLLWHRDAHTPTSTWHSSSTVPVIHELR